VSICVQIRQERYSHGEFAPIFSTSYKSEQELRTAY